MTSSYAKMDVSTFRCTAEMKGQAGTEADGEIKLREGGREPGDDGEESGGGGQELVSPPPRLDSPSHQPPTNFRRFADRYCAQSKPKHVCVISTEL